jgi:O-antigen biosynthesis protein
MISVTTPTHDDKFLGPLYESLKNQTHTDWEWVLVPNNGLKNATLSFDDPRVKIYPFEWDIDRVGALKRFACQNANGDILAEVDHDDILMPTCLQKVQEAFDSDPEICFVYSNSANMHTESEPWWPERWSTDYGWSYRDLDYQGRIITEARSAAPYPQSISRIWFAPNHIRAWKAKDYWAIGGHDQSMKISDDHDMILRSYLHGKIHHIDECLYIYRIHGENTWLEHQKIIQDTMWENYDRFIEPMMVKWSNDRGLRKIDICGGINPREGYESVDKKNADINTDLNKRWPFEDNSVGLIRAQDAVEHLKSPQFTMKEAYRVLAHGGVFMIAVPSTDGRGAFQDPTHVSYWNENSIRYYTTANLNQFINCPVRFQTMRCITVFRNDYERDFNIPYVVTELVAVKQAEPRYYGPLEI